MAEVLQLAGTIALLIWSLKLIQKSILKAFGNELRAFAKASDGRSLPAFISGIGIAAASQSSTATALLAATLTEQKVLTAATALFIILGADIGTAGAAFFASLYDGDILPAGLFLLGTALAIKSKRNRHQNIGQVMIGIGLLLTALSLLKAGTEVWQDSQSVVAVLSVLKAYPVALICVAAILTYSVYSSLAVILLIAQAQLSGMIDASSAIYLVVGANIGGSAPPVVTKLKSNRDCLSPLVLNLLLRSLVAVGLAIFASRLVDLIGPWSSDATFAVYVHLGLNLIAAIIGLIAGRKLLVLLDLMDWANRTNETVQTITSLDPDALSRPGEGLACAKREALRMADLVEKMLIEAGRALREPDIDDRNRISDLDDEVDELYVATKHYIAQLTQQTQDEHQTGQTLDLLNFIANMEHVGDIIDSGLSDVTHKQAAYGLHFSEEGEREIGELHAMVCQNFRLGINAVISEDVTLARQLVENKKAVRRLVDQSATTHLERLGSGDPKTVQSSSLHMDVLRDLRRINSHLVATAYPILTAAGHVRKTKWKSQVKSGKERELYKQKSSITVVAQN